MKIKTFIIHSMITIAILFLCTMMSFVLDEMDIRTENIIMLFLIGVLLIVVETRSLSWGIASSLLSIITFNYFFTKPVYTLQIDDPNYIITIFIFLNVSFIASSLVGKLQKHAQKAKRSAEQTSAFYEISKSYLTISGIDAIIMHTLTTLEHSEGIPCCIFYKQDSNAELQKFQLDQHIQPPCSLQQAEWAFTHASDCGHGTAFFEHDAWSYHPLYHNSHLLGVYALLSKEPIEDECFLFIKTLLSQMVMAMERELLYIQQEKNKIEIEKEKLRNNLLRSISHDLRTPLTGIAGSAALIKENYDTLSDDTICRLLQNICSDAVWLNQLVENLLNMTRIQDGKLVIKKQKEVVDDIIYEALQRVETRKGKHTFQVELPKDVILVPMDARLIIQVIINLLDNAIKHTQDDSSILIRCFLDQTIVKFEVIDNGNGIDLALKDTLFESFITTKSERSDAKRGIGLGLTICKAIIEAHNGSIYACNKIHGHGAVFGFTLPLEESEES